MSLKFPISLVGKRASSGGDGPFATSLYDSGDNLLVSIETDIPNNWNDNNTPYNATRLEIGTSCTSIGSYAFGYCTNLTGSLVIPDSVTSIGNQAFYYCNNLTGLLTIPNSVTTIVTYAFAGCTGFTGSLTIPDSVTTIGDYAFIESSGFDGSLTIGNSVTTIGVYAFRNCSAITSVSILATTAPTIGITSGAFSNMTSVSPPVIHVPSGATGYAASYDGLTVVYDL